MKRLLLVMLSVVFLCTLAMAVAAPSPQAHPELQAALVITQVNPKDGLICV